MATVPKGSSGMDLAAMVERDMADPFLPQTPVAPAVASLGGPGPVQAPALPVLTTLDHDALAEMASFNML